MYFTFGSEADDGYPSTPRETSVDHHMGRFMVGYTLQFLHGIRELVVGLATPGYAWYNLGDAECPMPFFPGPTCLLGTKLEVGRGRCIVNLQIPRTLYNMP